MDNVVDKLMYRPSEVSQALGFSRSKVYELIASGQLPSVRVAGSLRVPVASFKAWLEGQMRDSQINR